MEKDIVLHTQDHTFGVRTAGVALKNGKLLLQREINGNEYALPGGTVKLGETSQEALVREYREETGAEIAVVRLLWTEETFWEYNGRKQHGIAFYYLIDLAEDVIPEHGEFVSQKDNCNVVLGWVPTENLKEMTVYPRFLKQELSCMDGPIGHFISRE